MTLSPYCAALPLLVFGLSAPGAATADIYTWVDGSGTINVSNLPPPDGAHLTRVMAEATAKPDAQAAARRSEVQALTERVRELEGEIEAAMRAPAPPVVYPVIAAPPVVQYVVEMAAPQVQYVAAAPTMFGGGCDASGWNDCGAAWAPGFYPVSVIVVPGNAFRPFPPGHVGGSHPPVGAPARGDPGFRRG